MIRRLFSRFRRSLGVETPAESWEGARACAEHVVASPHEKGLVLLNVLNGRVFACNGVGSRLWQGISSGQSLNASVAALSAEYAVDPEVIRRDAIRFLAELEKQGLVTGRE